MLTDAEILTKKAEIEAEITEIDNALTAIRKGGQSYTITTGSGFGTSRTVTMADYERLVKHRKDLRQELRDLNNDSAIRVRAGW